MKVLIVDDNATMRKLIIRMLSQVDRRDFEFREAQDGDEALKLVASYAPELVICDLNMDKVDGIGVLQEIRRNGSTAQFGLVSSEGCVPETRQKALAAGAAFVLSKPFQSEDLWGAITGCEDWDMRTAARALKGILGDLLGIREAATLRLVPGVPSSMAGATVNVQIEERQFDISLFADSDARRILARALLALPETETILAPAIAESMTELVNIVAGHVKARTDGNARLGLPCYEESPSGQRGALASEVTLGPVTVVVAVAPRPVS
jgi:two-component system chemotaxis response regulator CheY